MSLNPPDPGPAREHSIDLSQGGRTKQSFKEESDINFMMRNYQKGQFPAVNPITPRYGDFTGVTDLHQAMNQVKAAESEFMRLPSAIRSRFGNDPKHLLDFIDEDTNRAEAIKLGLIAAPDEPAPKATEESPAPPKKGAENPPEPAPK